MNSDKEEICRLCFSTGHNHMHIFNNNEFDVNAAEVIRQHYQYEVFESDLLPNYVCRDCWIKTEAFHKFHQFVTTARGEFLKKLLAACVKDEQLSVESELEEYSDIGFMSIEIKPMMCEENENPDTMSHSDSLHNSITMDDQLMLNEQINIKDERDNASLSSLDDAGTTMNMSRPMHINDVSSIQRQQIIDQHFDMTCDLCDTNFDSYTSAQVHYKNEHQNSYGYIKCCQKKLRNGAFVNDHILWHLNPEVFRCDICGKFCVDKKTLSTHRLHHKKAQLKQFICDICSMSFATRGTLFSHIINKHASKAKFYCDLCDKKFPLEENLKVHMMLAHSSDSKIKSKRRHKIKLTSIQKEEIMANHFDMSCDECKKELKSLEEAQNHYLQEHNYSRGYVKCCSMKLKSVTCVTEHIAWHLNPLIFTCKICSRDLKSKAALTKHMQRHIDLENETHTCTKCNKVFGSEWCLRDHMSRLHKNGHKKKCKYCGKCFVNKDDVSTHIKIIHVPEMEAEQREMKRNQIISKNFDMTCDVCSANLDSLDQAKSHYKTDHNNPDGYVKCCGLKLKEPHLVNDHIRWHMDPDIFKCFTCGQEMKTRKSLYAHSAYHRTTSSGLSFTCDICKKLYRTRVQIKKHLLRVHIPKILRPYVCDACNKRFSSNKNLAEHTQLMHNSADDETFVSKTITTEEMNQFMVEHFDMTCDVCQKQLESLEAARMHYLTEHKFRRGYIKCCKIKHKHHSEIREHIEWHFNPKIFECKVCKKDFKNRIRLHSHLSHHEAKNSKRFVCGVCNKGFGKKAVLKEHTSRVHPGYSEQVRTEARRTSCEESDGTSIANTETGSYTDKDCKGQTSRDAELTIPEYIDMTCDLCSVTFESFNHAQEHYLHEHSVKTGFVKCCNIKLKHRWKLQDHIIWHRNPEAFKCKECHKCFKDNINLRTHLLTHGSRFKCDLCERSLRSKSQLKRHKMFKHNSKERKFKCKFCEKRFAHEAYLKSHVDRLHLPGEKQICEICAKVCASKQLLNIHLQMHSKDPSAKKEKMQCNICGAWLTTRYTLKDHMLRHTSEPKKCDQCGKVSPNTNALRLHIKVVHADAIHQCHLCEKSFKRSVALKDHVATHTGEKLYKCLYCPETFIWRPNCYSHQKKAHLREWTEDQAKKAVEKRSSK